MTSIMIYDKDIFILAHVLINKVWSGVSRLNAMKLQSEIEAGLASVVRGP